MVSVEDWLRANGVAIAQGLRLTSASAVNADGSVVVGSMRTSEGTPETAYLARVSPFGNGLMYVDPYYQTLSGARLHPRSTALVRNPRPPHSEWRQLSESSPQQTRG
jgi:uncharacterized membrane protein